MMFAILIMYISSHIHIIDDLSISIEIKTLSYRTYDGHRKCIDYIGAYRLLSLSL